ncbi:heme-binding protein [Amylibacter sp. SFDW26]|uniref:GlcG/HbpS family heme-binding protein n=1 Tax=Amylibacter sp. SFDW26 TaxID=2652722 RepID=UPI001262597E|nr:heme-binding protein [Amylibacter sp. SFDW26]KAB7614521.1 heme-binding protein [Amylibacter sp. SFDW26]
MITERIKSYKTLSLLNLIFISGLAVSPLQATAKTVDAPVANTFPLSYGTNISHACAASALSAAVEYAQSKNWAVSIAVVDTAGQVMALGRLDNAHRASPDFAMAKASSAVMTKRSTKVFSDALSNGRSAILGFSDLHVHAAEGGEVLVKGDEIIGGIGAAGVTQKQDREISLAAVAAVANC